MLLYLIPCLMLGLSQCAEQYENEHARLDTIDNVLKRPKHFSKQEQTTDQSLFSVAFDAALMHKTEKLHESISLDKYHDYLNLLKNTELLYSLGKKFKKPFAGEYTRENVKTHYKPLLLEYQEYLLASDLPLLDKLYALLQFQHLSFKNKKTRAHQLLYKNMDEANLIEKRIGIFKRYYPQAAKAYKKKKTAEFKKFAQDWQYKHFAVEKLVKGFEPQVFIDALVDDNSERKSNNHFEYMVFNNCWSTNLAEFHPQIISAFQTLSVGHVESRVRCAVMANKNFKEEYEKNILGVLQKHPNIPEAELRKRAPFKNVKSKMFEKLSEEKQRQYIYANWVRKYKKYLDKLTAAQLNDLDGYPHELTTQRKKSLDNNNN